MKLTAYLGILSAILMALSIVLPLGPWTVFLGAQSLVCLLGIVVYWLLVWVHAL